MQNLLNDLRQLLKQDDRLMVEDELLKNKIIELALKLDENLIRLLLSHSRLRQHFFADIDGVLVFDKEKFLQFVSNKAFLPDSYTAFKNKIGLTDDGGATYLSRRREVVLAWPYRDCVLEGGQTEEDAKRDEIFWNETLAPDDIDRLLDPKVLTNFRRIDAYGEHPVKEIADTDSLIIKGNNLLALHSLLPRLRGQVKLIYIDPPYNTGNDSFGYNDRFNHSAWLTFMKNRLEVAKAFLRDDGAIAIQIDDNEIAYLTVLADELFDRDNMVSLITIRRSAPTGHKAINPSPINVCDYVLLYAKDRTRWNYRMQYTEREYDTAYSLFIENFEEGYSKWKFTTVNEALKKYTCSIEKLIETFPDRVARFAIPNYSGVGKKTRKLIDESKQRPGVIIRQEREEFPDIYLLDGQRILFYKDKLKEIDGKLVTAEPLTNLWTDIPFQGIANEGQVVLRKGKKPENLIRRIIDISTEEGDLVMDFFLGTGTTAAVAHKTGRQYIGVEQLDYGENDSIVRLKNVINGDESGISKAVGWKGGGDFVTCELMQWNGRCIGQIQAAQSAEELQALWETLQAKAFLSYKVDFDQFDEHAEDFAQLSLADQKRFLLEVLDKNQLYVNLSEIDDADYQVSDEDKRLNRQFYNTEQN